MPTHEPEPQAPPSVIGFVPNFQPVAFPAQTVEYPADHRPAPLHRPVLIPEQAPPMHQGMNDATSAFFPSFLNQHGAHIPGLQQEEPEEVFIDDLELDAELMELEESNVSSYTNFVFSESFRCSYGFVRSQNEQV